MQGKAGVKDNANMYRVGDYVYFENSASGVYAVRRIEELNKNANGNVEARVMCFYRRNEVPHSLVPLADKHHWGEADIQPDSDDEDSPAAAAGEERTGSGTSSGSSSSHAKQKRCRPRS